MIDWLLEKRNKTKKNVPIMLQDNIAVLHIKQKCYGKAAIILQLGCSPKLQVYCCILQCMQFYCYLGMCVNLLFFFYPHYVHHLPWFVEKPSFCFHEKDPGVCRGYFSRYFYNKETKLCEVFKYGGCLGNQNNFRSLEECQTTCQDNCKLMSSLFLVLFLHKQCHLLQVSCMEEKAAQGIMRCHEFI